MPWFIVHSSPDAEKCQTINALAGLSPGCTQPSLILRSSTPRFSASLFHAHRVKRRSSRNEKRFAVFAAKHQLRRTSGNFDGVNQFAGGVVNINLPGGDIHIAARIRGYAFTALLSEQLKVSQTSIR